MPETVIGVIGPQDLVTVVVKSVDASANLKALPLPYRHESEAPDIVRHRRDDVDAWLFTGPVPRRLAQNAGVLRLPAEAVSHSGVTLLAALMRFQSAGQDISALSIDTLNARETIESLSEAGLPTRGVRIMRASLNTTSEQVLDFHRASRRNNGTTIAVTCLSSAYKVLRAEMTSVRLVPSHRDIREAIASLKLKCGARRHADAQVVIGLLETSHPTPVDDSLFAELGATTSQLADGSYLLITTRGPLMTASEGLATAPIPDSLVSSRGHTRLGLGVGRSAGEARSLAKQALSRAAANGRNVAVVCMSNDPDIILHPASSQSRRTAQTNGQVDLADLSLRVGIRRSTLQKVRLLAHRNGDAGITSAAAAAEFGIQERSARRLLTRLQHAAIATAVGSVSDGRNGRPPTVYKILY